MKKILPILCFTLLPMSANAQTLDGSVDDFIKNDDPETLFYSYGERLLASASCPWTYIAAEPVIARVISRSRVTPLSSFARETVDSQQLVLSVVAQCIGSNVVSFNVNFGRYNVLTDRDYGEIFLNNDGLTSSAFERAALEQLESFVEYAMEHYIKVNFPSDPN